MAVAQPDILLKFDEASGTAIANAGTLASGGYTIIGGGTEGDDYTHHTNADPALSYLTSHPNGQWVYGTTAATGPGTTVEQVQGAFKFNLKDMAGGTRKIFTKADEYQQAYCTTNGGGFDLHIDVYCLGGTTAQLIWTALSLNTIYKVSWACDFSTITSVAIHGKLDAASVVTGTPVNMSGSTNMGNTWPIVLGQESSGYGELDTYYFAYDRGGTAWSDSDLDSINANPNFITGWGGAAATAIPIFQNNYQLR